MGEARYLVGKQQVQLARDEGAKDVYGHEEK